MTGGLDYERKTKLQNRTSRKGGETKRGEVMQEAGLSPPRLVYRGFIDPAEPKIISLFWFRISTTHETNLQLIIIIRK